MTRELVEEALLSEDPVASLETLDEEGVLGELLPEVTALKMAPPPGVRHKDNYLHTLRVVANIHQLGAGDDIVLLMAGLLHDIGKPDTREVEDGQVTFRSHEHVGAALAKKRLEELGYERAFIKQVTKLIRLHLRAFGYEPGSWEDAGMRRYARDAGELMERLNILIKADVTSKIPGKVERLRGNVDDLAERIAQLQAKEKRDALRPPIDGNRVMELLGIPAGPELGVIMRHLNSLVREGADLDVQKAEKEALSVAREKGIVC